MKWILLFVKKYKIHTFEKPKWLKIKVDEIKPRQWKCINNNKNNNKMHQKI